MNKSDAFFSEQKFTAREHFPHGISRSGDFSLNQTKLLEQHGYAYQELHNGSRQPINDEEFEFVEMCKGNKEASTPHELVWQRFLSRTKSRIKVSSFSSPSKKQDSLEDMSEESTSSIEGISDNEEW